MLFVSGSNPFVIPLPRHHHKVMKSMWGRRYIECIIMKDMYLCLKTVTVFYTKIGDIYRT